MTAAGSGLAASRRTKLVLDRYDNAYAVFPFGRIAAASKDAGHPTGHCCTTVVT